MVTMAKWGSFVDNSKLIERKRSSSWTFWNAILLGLIFGVSLGAIVGSLTAFTPGVVGWYNRVAIGVLGLTFGLLIGSFVGWVFGLINGVALAIVLAKCDEHVSTVAELKRVVRSTTIPVSVFGVVTLALVIWNDGFGPTIVAISAIAAPVAAVWMGGIFCNMYVAENPDLRNRLFPID